ncbi:MAG: M67 family metallopeptidase [Synechococcales bacterium]|nr:M67 family metallopeptidase [Synechococcales bacterium]
MVLNLHPHHLRQIAAHAERTYPQECCGLLLGRMPTGDTISTQASQPPSPRFSPGKTVVEIWESTNAWNEEAAATLQSLTPTTEASPHSKADRYWIDPKEMLTAQRWGRDRQLNIIGVYHSHPDHLAIPSECDRACVWSEYSYIIVAVRHGSAQDVLCWTLDEHHQFQPEGFRLLAPSAPI